jgi:hypothetical protein
VRHLTIAFVGQCHTVGYPGVPPDAAFPQVCRADIQDARPGETVRVLAQPYYHPAELERTVRTVLGRAPRIVILEVIGWLTVAGTRAVDLSRLPWGTRTAYERVRHLRDVSRLLRRRTVRQPVDRIYRVQGSATEMAAGILRGLLPRYPRPTVEEYEACIGAALESVRAVPGLSVVVQGPGAPNLTLASRSLAPDMIERYRQTRDMAERVAHGHGALYVDRWDTVTGTFYRDGSIRPTAQAHSVWGHLLASELLRAGIV